MKRLLSIACLALLLSLPLGFSHAAETEIVVNAVGDVMLAGRWEGEIRRKGYDFPFRATAAEFSRGDINLANLESPLSRSGTEYTSKKFRFRGDPAISRAIARAGINLVTLANNHSMDFGEQALAETMQHLKEAGIAWIGAGKNLEEARRQVIFTVKGKRIAFLGYSLTQPTEFFAAAGRHGTAPGLASLFTADIAHARREADLIIVTFHWGTEGSTTTRAYQQSAARRAIDAGADAVIGHHPHVLQGIERYKRGIIFYSLGNFAFASTSRTASSAALVRLRFGEAGRTAEIVPLDVLAARVRFQPKVLEGERGMAVIELLNRLSHPFNTTIRSADGRHTITF